MKRPKWPKAQTEPTPQQAEPTPESPTPEPQPTPRSPAGRPSKVETRAWDLYSRSATVSMTRDQRLDKFREAVTLAEDFADFWGKRR